MCIFPHLLSAPVAPEGAFIFDGGDKIQLIFNIFL